MKIDEIEAQLVALQNLPTNKAEAEAAALKLTTATLEQRIADSQAETLRAQEALDAAKAKEAELQAAKASV